MNRPQPTPSSAFDTASIPQQLKTRTPDTVIALIIRQLTRAQDAAERIQKEGLVVRDIKGSVIPHPAIQIELAATKTVCDVLAKWSK